MGHPASTHAHQRRWSGATRRENATGQYAADGTIKINVLRDHFHQKNAQMAKVHPHKFQSNYLIYWRRGVGIEPAYTALQAAA